MSSFPSSIYSPRTKQNKAGVVYDASKATVGYAEDVTKLDDEVVALETCLGLGPKWASADVKERLKGIRSLSDSNEDVLIVKGAYVGIGTVNPSFPAHVIGVAVPALCVEEYSGAAGTALTVFPQTVRSARGTEASPVALKTNDVLFGLGGRGYNGSAFTTTSRATVAGQASEDWTTIANGTFISFYTTANGAVSQSIRMTIDNAGNVGIGVGSPSRKLDILSDIIRLRTAKTPATSGAAGNAGDFCWDSSYWYICIATNTWRRIAHDSW